MRLDGIRDPDAEGRPVAEEPLEARHVVRRRDEQHVPDAGEHQARQRVVDHRFVVHRQQLLRDAARHRVKPRAGASGENDAFHLRVSISGGIGRHQEASGAALRPTGTASAAAGPGAGKIAA
jgi:hypothetical protein